MEAQTKIQLERLEAWVPDELKEKYWRSMAYLKSIPPEDEIFQLLEAMGIISTVMRQVPSEMAQERVKFREEFALISAELKTLLEQATAQAVGVSSALEKVNSATELMMKSCDAGARTMVDALDSAASRVNVKAISDRLAYELQANSIRPISQLNEKLLITEVKFSDLAVKTEIMIDSLKKARWWVPWVAAFSVSGALFCYAWVILK